MLSIPFQQDLKIKEHIMPNSPLLHVPPATVLRWRSASSFVPADQLAEEMGPWDHHCCRCCDFAWSWLDIRLDIYSILIWVVWPLLWIRFSATLDSHPNEKIARRKGSTRCAENGDDKQKSAPFRRAIHYCSCAVFAATEVMLGLKRRLAGVILHR